MKKYSVLLTVLVLSVLCSACSNPVDMARETVVEKASEDTKSNIEETVAPISSPDEEVVSEEISVSEKAPVSTLQPGRRFKSKNWEYLIRDDGMTAKVFSYNNDKSESVTIPSELDGIPVTETGGLMFSNKSRVMSVTIPNSIIHMDSNPFHNARNLVQIIVEPGHPFLEVSGGVLFDKEEKRLVSYPMAMRPSSEEYTIPDGTEIIGKGAFSHGTLRKINIPDSVRIIGECAFIYCRTIKSIHLPEGLTELGRAAFYECVWLEEVNIPVGITVIHDCMFENCGSLKEFVVPDHVHTIEDEAFAYCANLKSVTVPSSVSSMGKDVFKNSKNVTVRVEKGSYAEAYCIENDLNYDYIQ